MTETPELRVNGEWLCLNIETRIAWPTKPQPFEFEGIQLWLIPLSTDNHPGIALNRPPTLNRDDAWALLHRALSLIAWTQNTGATVAYMSSGNLPRMMGLDRSSGFAIRDEFDFSDLPQIADDKAKLALALMREGRGLNHPAYAFLSFFRVLETAISNGRKRGEWITEHVDRIEGHRAKDALAKLRETVNGDVGVHLSVSGRHAIAHAKADPIINPDNPQDARRLHAELPIIEALAELAVEEHLGVQTSHTIWREHLYELRGWKALFGEEIVADVLAGVPPVDGQNVDVPILDVRLRRSPPFLPLEGMTPLEAGYGDGRVEVIYRSFDGLVDFIFWLNFSSERLEFDVRKSIVVRDDGTVIAARNAKDIARFYRDYFANGEIQMWDHNNKKLISRCDAFIPVNCYLNMDAANAGIDRWDPIIAEREKAAT